MTAQTTQDRAPGQADAGSIDATNMSGTSGKKPTEEEKKQAQLLQAIIKEKNLTPLQQYALRDKLQYANELREVGKKKFFFGKILFTIQVILHEDLAY